MCIRDSIVSLGIKDCTLTVDVIVIAAAIALLAKTPLLVPLLVLVVVDLARLEVGHGTILEAGHWPAHTREISTKSTDRSSLTQGVASQSHSADRNI